MIKRKLGAVVLTTAMILSLVGCSKKNFDGNYTAEFDYSAIVQKDFEDTFEISDYEWKGTLIEPISLELSEGEYSYAADAEATMKNYEAYILENIDIFYYVFDVTEDELSEYGCSDIWEYGGYETKEDLVADFMSVYDISDFEDEESGEYEIDGDVVTLNGVDIIYDDGDKGEGWPLTYEDGDLVGQMYIDEDGEESVDVRFVRDED